MRLVIMAQDIAVRVHRRNAVARRDQLALFNHQPVCARDQNIAVTHQRRQPRPRACRAFARLALIITIGVALFQIIGNCGLWP